MDDLKQQVAVAEKEAEEKIDGMQVESRVASLRTKLATTSTTTGRPDLSVVANALERAVEAGDPVGIRAARIVGAGLLDDARRAGGSQADTASKLARRMQDAEDLERGDAPRIERELARAESARRELRYAVQSTEPRITGRQPDLLGGPGTWAHDVLGVTLADQGGGVVMPEPVEPASAA